MFKGRPIRAGRGTAAERVILSGDVQSVADFFEDPDFDPKLKAAFRDAAGSGSAIADLRSTLAVPMKRDAAVVGVIVIARSQTGPFPQRQIELLQTFADQAVIAIENARLFDEVQAKTRELSDSLEQQTAAADILRAISSSPTDVQPVLEAIAHRAAELCDATNSGVFRVRDGLIDLVGHHNLSREQLDHAQGAFPAPLDRGIVSGRAILNRAIVHIPDIAADPEYSALAIVKAGFRSALSVPMLRKGEPIGAINVTRMEPRPFSDRQIELLRTFADQAVIAINNVGLFNESQEALQQQTATAEVLKAISRSAFDLQTVLDTLVRSAVALCDAIGGMIYIKSGDAFHGRAFADYNERIVRHLKTTPQHPGRGSVGARVLLTGEVQNIADLREDSEYDALLLAATEHRAVLGVPLLRDKAIVGAIVLGRRRPEAFTQRQIDLVQTFADQAVIAIENVRLFDEVQARTRDLSEALQQQTATADVLKVISRSAFDLQAVLDTLVESAVSLIDASSGVIWLREGDVFTVKAASSAEDQQEFFAQLRARPQKPGRHSIGARVLLTGKVQIVNDIKVDPEYDPVIKAATSARTLLGVPLLRDGVIIGAFVLALHELGTFTPRQIELVQTFADQAVIAIENVRLFDEVQARTRDLTEALQQQTATADVLKVISRSVFDLDTVLQTLIDTAVHLAHGNRGTIFIKQDDVLVARAFHRNVPDSLRAYLSTTTWRLDGDSHMARAARDGGVVHIPDLQRSHVDSDEQTRARARFRGRTLGPAHARWAGDRRFRRASRRADRLH